MMTMKIIHNTGEEQDTSLFEGNNLRYRYVNFKDFKDYCQKWGELTEGHSIPCDGNACYVGEDEGAGSFLAIHYNDNNRELCFIGARKSTVYIMHEGKTIDTIYC